MLLNVNRSGFGRTEVLHECKRVHIIACHKYLWRCKLNRLAGPINLRAGSLGASQLF